MALASRIAEGDEKARIPVFRKRKKLFHFREFHRAQHGGADAVCIRIQRDRPCGDAHVDVVPWISAAFFADEDKSHGLFALFRRTKLRRERSRPVDQGLHGGGESGILDQHVAQHLCIHRTVCDADIVHEFIQNVRVDLFRLEPAVRPAADA